MKKAIVVLCTTAIFAALGFFFGSTSAVQKPIPPDTPWSDAMDTQQKTEALEIGKQRIQIMMDNKKQSFEAGKTGAFIGAPIGLIMSIAFVSLRNRKNSSASARDLL